MIAKLPTKEHVEAFEKAGLVTVRSHNELPLRIINYTPKAQYERAWTPELLQCRGLIVDPDWNIVARPFPKFFNHEEHVGDAVAGPLPIGRFTATEKYDGSLGILWHWDNNWGVATRGSFHSEQAIKANEIANGMNLRIIDGYTHLFEIIYPSNRIVLDYGQDEKLVYLTSIHNQTGEEKRFVDVYGGVEEIEASVEYLMKPRANAEGYVLRFENGQRVKVKHEEYVRLHRIVTGLSTTSVWEHLSSGGTMEQLLDPLPDEWMNWAKVRALMMLDIHQEKHEWATDKSRQILDVLGDGWTRKQYAEVALTYDNPSYLFLALDKNYDGLDAAIWKSIKPDYAKPITADVC